ncbi:hypothetical protein lerEdw1_015579 [Lerista edwardsae]|nr:hypothetical protein lerEdw1_015579 [Lerista edwardsae]
MATAVQGEELLSPAPPIGPGGGRSRPSSSLPLIFSNICYICMMSLLLCVKSRDGGGGPEPREDAPSPAQDPPALPRFDAADSASYVLPRLEGVKASTCGHRAVGHIQEVELVPNKIHFMKTLSLKPLAFEIPDFLSEDECKLLIHLAKHEGLQKSPTAFSKDRADYLEKLTVKQVETFDYLDFNQDGQLQMIEMLAHERLSNNLWLTPADVQEMYVALKADPDGNGVLSFHEFKEVNMQDFYKYMDRKKGNQSELVRNSQQVWLDQRKQAHPIMHAIRQRVVHLTRLPAEMIEYSENLQVVQYAQGGYYHAHWDSEDGFSEVGCGHTKSSENIYMAGDTATCRVNGQSDQSVSAVALSQEYGAGMDVYATVLIYLNNVMGGGETTFPIADNRTYDLAVCMCPHG